jgi:hypothetical protein
MNDTHKDLDTNMQLSIKLESIFMPYARRQRDTIYDDKSGINYVKFVHYTSAEAALSIIKSKSIWMRNATAMVDYREVQHGFTLISNFFRNKEKREAFVSALDQCALGVAQEAINLFDQHWENIQWNTYVTSISEHSNKEDLHGRLSMWRAFGGNTARVAIIFKVPYLSDSAEALNLFFSPVAYLTENEVDDVICEVITNIKNNCDFLRSIDRQIIIGVVFNMFLAAVTCLKHEGFHEEKEWRAIYNPSIQRSELMESSIEVINGIPQPIYKIPLDKSVSSALADLDFSVIFDRLIIGPTAYPLVMSDAFSEALKQAGVADADNRVVNSNIPIRS